MKLQRKRGGAQTYRLCSTFITALSTDVFGSGRGAKPTSVENAGECGDIPRHSDQRVQTSERAWLIYGSTCTSPFRGSPPREPSGLHAPPLRPSPAGTIHHIHYYTFRNFLPDFRTIKMARAQAEPQDPRRKSALATYSCMNTYSCKP